MTITTTSPRGRAFMRGHEGNPLTCYLDPVGIPTIGTGFTMRSAAVRRAMSKLGITKLVPGKTKITAAQSDSIFDAVLADEFEAAVVASSPASRKQHQMDAAVSAIYNLGVGAAAVAAALCPRPQPLTDQAPMIVGLAIVLI